MYEVANGVATTYYTFTGQKQDDSGLIYMNARYYDPVTGQFISPDSLVPDATNLLTYNRYMYTVGNPLCYNDPTGHCPQCLALIQQCLDEGPCQTGLNEAQQLLVNYAPALIRLGQELQNYVLEIGDLGNLISGDTPLERIGRSLPRGQPVSGVTEQLYATIKKYNIKPYAEIPTPRDPKGWPAHHLETV